MDKGLALLRTLPADDAQQRAELLLRLTQGAALLAISGFGAADVEETYLRAQALCLRTGDREALPPVLSGLWNLYVTRADFARARSVADALFERAPPEAALTMLAHNALGYTLLFVGEPAAVPAHIEACQALYEPRLHRHLALQYGEDPGVVCRMLATLPYWLLGDRQRSMDHLDRGHELARMLAHPFSEAQMLWVEAVVCCDDGALERLDDVTQRLIVLCLDNDFPLWLAGGRILRGRALAGRGRFDEGLAEAMHGLDAWRAMGGLLLPHALAVVASIHAGNGERAAALRLLDEALQAVQRTGERWYEAELWRLHGEAMQADGSEPAQRQARASFETAIGIARRQQARLLELRATANVTRLSKQRGASASIGR